MELVGEIVSDALGERPIAVIHVPTLEESHVYRLHLSSGVAYFKSEHEGHPIAVAAWAYEKAATVGVPVPTVLHLDLSRERWAEEFMIITSISGADLQHDPLQGSALQGVLEGYGELLRRLHSVVLDGFGDLEFRDAVVGDPIGPFADHASHVRASLNWSLPYVIEHELVGADRVGAHREDPRASRGARDRPGKGCASPRRSRAGSLFRRPDVNADHRTHRLRAEVG